MKPIDNYFTDVFDDHFFDDHFDREEEVLEHFAEKIEPSLLED